MRLINDHPGLHSDCGALQRGVVHTHNPRALWLRFPCWQSGNQLTSVNTEHCELKNTPGDLRHRAVQPSNLEADVHKPQPTDCSDHLFDHGVTQVFPNYCHCWCSIWCLWRHQQTFTHHNSIYNQYSIHPKVLLKLVDSICTEGLMERSMLTSTSFRQIW